MQSPFTFEEKIDIEDLVLPPKQTGATSIMTIDIKEEPSDVGSLAVHERTEESGFARIHIESKDLQSGMVNVISKLFEELDMLNQYDNDQRRVEKIRQLFEKYHKVNQSREMNSAAEILEKDLEEKKTELSKLKQELASTRSEFKITNHQLSSENISLKTKMVEITEEQKVALSLNSKTLNSIVKMHEKSLEDKNLELKRFKEELQIVKSANSDLSKRIQELDIASNQLSGAKESTNLHFQTLNKKEELENSEQCVNQKGSRNEKITSGKKSIEFINLKNENHQENEDTNSATKKSTKVSCDICQKMFLCQKYLRKHKKTTHASTEPKYCCDQCGKKFQIQNYLTTHIRVTHSNNQYVCNQCGFKYTRKFSLIRHKCKK